MKCSTLIMLSFLAACASTKNKVEGPRDQSSEVKRETFKKEKQLTINEVPDYYSLTSKTLNPALQDETIDRYSADEISKMAESNDPLLEMSLRCTKKDFSNAFAVASRAFNRYQKIPAYWNLIGNCHLAQGASRKALLFYNKALEMSPNYVPALNNIGVLYSRQGEDQKALVAFERANKQSPFSKTPRYNLARLYLVYGIAQSALPLFQGLLNESKDDVELLNAVANCHFILADYPKALSHFKLIPPQLLRRAELGLNFALTLKKSGRLEDARKIFDSIETPKSKELRDYYSVVGHQLGVQ